MTGEGAEAGDLQVRAIAEHARSGLKPQAGDGLGDLAQRPSAPLPRG
jgi:hypothetical protein